MIDFGKWAFANRKLVYFVVAVLLVGGILSAYDMSKLEDPEIKVKLAMVIATRPGASAHEMELEVTDPLEKNIRTMGEVESVTSSSFNDLPKKLLKRCRCIFSHIAFLIRPIKAKRHLRHYQIFRNIFLRQ